MKAVGSNVIIKPAIDENGDKKIGSIFVPDSAHRDVLERGKIVSYGERVFISPNGDDLEPEFEIGDTILFLRGNGIPVQYNEQEHYIIQLADIILRE